MMGRRWVGIEEIADDETGPAVQVNIAQLG